MNRRAIVNRPIFIMIAGGSATGKSSQVIPRLLSEFGADAVLIEQDWYQLGVNFIDKDTSPYRWDDPRNFQIDQLKTDLTNLKNGKSIITPSFDVLAVESRSKRLIEPRPIVIVDGIYALYGGLETFADYSIYVAVPLYGRFLRRLFRMVYEQGQDKPQTAFKHSFGPVLRAHYDFVGPQAESADYVLELPYSFTESIKKYNLRPKKGAHIPFEAKVLFTHGHLRFQGCEENHSFHFYIVYKDKVYYDFLIDQVYAPLLSGVDYLSV